MDYSISYNSTKALTTLAVNNINNKFNNITIIINNNSMLEWQQLQRRHQKRKRKRVRANEGMHAMVLQQLSTIKIKVHVKFMIHKSASLVLHKKFVKNYKCS